MVRTALIIVRLWAAQADDGAAARNAMLTGHYAEAVKLYRRMEAAAEDGTPEKTGLRMNLALALEKTGRPADAAALLEGVVRALPGSAPAWFLLGLAYQQLGQPAKAVNPLKEAARLQPDNAEAFLELGDAELASGRPRDAVATFRVLTARQPGMAKAIQGLGLAYAALGERALAAMQEAAMQDKAPPAPEPDWFQHQEWETGLANAEKVSNPRNLYWASKACEKLAERQFAKLLQMAPTQEMHELLAQSYSRLNRRVESVSEWRKALAMSPADRRLQGRLAEALVRNRQLDEAKRLIEPLAAAAPQNGEFQYLLGDVLLEDRQEDAALGHLETAEKLLPDHLPTQEALGRAYLALGQPAKAVAHLERARALDDGSISFALSAAYKKLGRDEESRAALERYKLLTSKIEAR